MQWNCGAVEQWSSAQCGEEAAATAAAAGADPNAERSRQGRSGQIRAGQVWTDTTGSEEWHDFKQKPDNYSKRNGPAAAHSAGRSQHGPARRSKQPGQAGLDLQQHARTCSKQYGIFLARGYSGMASPVPADSTTNALQQSPSSTHQRPRISCQQAWNLCSSRMLAIANPRRPRPAWPLIM